MITPECELSLDEYEGFPHLCEKKLVNVSHQDHGDVEAMVYIMSKPSSLQFGSWKCPLSAQFRYDVFLQDLGVHSSFVAS